ncbi:MAG: universal stress protein, partial [Deltaproteobacteria bacterium]
IAERLAERSRTMTLFVPRGARGFVSLADGEMSLRRILLPVDRHPSPVGAIAYAARAAALMGDPPVEISLLHVGDAADLPELDLPDSEICRFERLARAGDVVREIAKAARETRADLIVMPTLGREGVLDALRGSITQQVLRRVQCPMLAVPMR